jgi:hypothetical protein
MMLQMTGFFSFYGGIVLQCVYEPLVVGACLGGFHVLATVRTLAVNAGLQMSLQHTCIFPLVMCAAVGSFIF